MQMKLTTILMAVGICAVLLLSVGHKNDAQTGAGIGTLARAGIGQLAGGSTEATLIGAAVGGGAGYLISNEQDKKKAKAEMEDLQAEMEVVTVDVANSNGSVIPVKLRKQGVGYVGPRGEYYDTLPTSEQLRPIYGF